MAAALTVAAFPAFSKQKVVEAVDTLTLERAFADLPVRSMDLLNRSTRLDMLDYLRADSLLVATNTMGGTSQIEKASKDYLRVRLTPVSTIELAILPYRDPKSPRIAMVIYTIGSAEEAPDSDIAFYDGSMRLMERDRLFPEPQLKEFFEIPKGSQTSMKEIREMIPFPAAEYTLTPDPMTLTGRLSVAPLLSVEDRKLVELFLRPGLTWHWDGRRWKQ